MKDEQFFSNIINGKLSKKVTQEIADLLAVFEGQRICIKIGKVRKERSSNQNRYYWGIVVNEFRNGAKDMWGEDLGSDEAHEYLKIHCNYKELINYNTSEVIKMPQTTTDLNTLQFEEYLERCRKLIYEYFGIIVALPNEQKEIFI